MSGLVLLAVGLTRQARPAVTLLLLVAAANAPWVVAGLLHASQRDLERRRRRSSASTPRARCRHRSPPSPSAASGTPRWSRPPAPAWCSRSPSRCSCSRPPRPAPARRCAASAGRTTGALVALWVLGYALAVLSWATPDAVGWIAAHVPGGGLLRDGTRFLVLCAPLTVVLVAAGVERLAGRWRDRAPRVLVAVAAALVPLAVMPDAAWGISRQPAAGRLPRRLRRGTQRAGRPAGGRPAGAAVHQLPGAGVEPRPQGPRPAAALPPARLPRQRPALPSSGRLIDGEDPRVPEVLAALGEPDPESRAAALGRIGIGTIARETDVADELDLRRAGGRSGPLPGRRRRADPGRRAGRGP